MINREWSEFLLIQYKNNKKNTQWDEIKECHDEEDCNFFKMLDKEKVPVRAWPSINGEEFNAWAEKHQARGVYDLFRNGKKTT